MARSCYSTFPHPIGTMDKQSSQSDATWNVTTTKQVTNQYQKTTQDSSTGVIDSQLAQEFLTDEHSFNTLRDCVWAYIGGCRLGAILGRRELKNGMDVLVAGMLEVSLTTYEGFFTHNAMPQEVLTNNSMIHNSGSISVGTHYEYRKAMDNNELELLHGMRLKLEPQETKPRYSAYTMGYVNGNYSYSAPNGWESIDTYDSSTELFVCGVRDIATDTLIGNAELYVARLTGNIVQLL